MNFLKNKNILLIILGFYTFLYFIFKYLYPFPDGVSDSGGYVLSAIQNQWGGYRPFGYSWFLIILHKISISISFVTFIQYILNIISTLCFIFTICYFFPVKNKIKEYFFIIFSICSIITIYLTNCILSDSLFTSLTLLWITTGIWFLNNSKNSIMIFLIHLLLLIFLFTVRYTGIFYLGITFIIIYLTEQTKVKKIIFSLIIVLSMFITYNHQTEITKEMTGIKSLGGFSGWFMANNALHILPHIQLDENKIDNAEIKQFAVFAKTFDSLSIIDNTTTAKFLWLKDMPLKQYLFYRMSTRQTQYLNEYTYLGTYLYNKFAIHIIKEYPFSYIRYFIIPNTLGILYPKFDDVYYSYDTNFIPKKHLQTWFQTNVNFYSRSNIVEKLKPILPIFCLIIWILFFFFSIKSFLIKTNLTLVQNKIYWILAIFIFMYLLFHIYTAPFALRYIAPIQIIQITIIYIGMFNKK